MSPEALRTTLSTRHPVHRPVVHWALPVSYPKSHRSWTFCPFAAGGRATVVVKNDPPDTKVPHAGRFCSGLLHDDDTLQLYAPVLKVPPAARMSVKAPDPILISSMPAS